MSAAPHDEARMLKRLSALQNRATRYECVVMNAAGQTALVGYSPRHSMTGLRDMLRDDMAGAAVAAFCGAGARARMEKRGAEYAITSEVGAECGTVKWSGRTQRDAICSRAEHALVTKIAASGGVQ